MNLQSCFHADKLLTLARCLNKSLFTLLESRSSDPRQRIKRLEGILWGRDWGLVQKISLWKCSAKSPSKAEYEGKPCCWWWCAHPFLTSCYFSMRCSAVAYPCALKLPMFPSLFPLNPPWLKNKAKQNKTLFLVAVAGAQIYLKCKVSVV
jgi:hypothetical protein